MKPHSGQDAVGFWFAEDFNQRFDRVRVQVVVDQVNLFGVGIKDIDQITNRFGPFVFRPTARNQQMATTCFRFKKDEDIPSAASDILVVASSDIARLERQFRISVG